MRTRKLLPKVVAFLVSSAWAAARAPSRSPLGPSPLLPRQRQRSAARSPRSRTSTVELVGDALSQATDLFGSEIRLAKAEISAKVGLAVAALASIAVAGVFLIVALVILLQALVAWLKDIGWSAPLANGIVGGGVALLATITAAIALGRLSAFRLRPERSITQAKKSVEIVQRKANS